MSKRSSQSLCTLDSKTDREENFLNIATLPSDVIRQIIRTGQKALTSMMLVSKLFNSIQLFIRQVKKKRKRNYDNKNLQNNFTSILLTSQYSTFFRYLNNGKHLPWTT